MITASGIAAGSISSVTVTLNNLTHARPDDIEILLVSPWGAKLVVLADAGGASTPVSGVNLTLDDAAANLVPDAGPMISGTFRPTCVDNLNNIATEFRGVTVADPADRTSGSATFTSVSGGHVRTEPGACTRRSSPAPTTPRWAVELSASPPQSPWLGPDHRGRQQPSPPARR
jgi:hypothetical protein